MKAEIIFEAETRQATGRGAARALRRAGKVPAVLYSKKLKPISFALELKELSKEYLKGAFQSKLVEIKLDGKSYHALARDLQLHPVSDQIEHADFLQVDESSRIAVEVPIKIVGAQKSRGIKMGGTLNMVRHTVELLCSPANIPTKITVDVSNATIGDSIHISQVDLPEGVTPTITDRDFTLVTIAGRIKETAQTTAEATDGEDGESADDDSAGDAAGE